MRVTTMVIQNWNHVFAKTTPIDFEPDNGTLSMQRIKEGIYRIQEFSQTEILFY